MNSGVIPRGQNLSKRQTVFFTSVDPLPCLAWYKQKLEKTPVHGVFGRYVQLAPREGFKCNQTRCNAIILYNTLPACCVPKAIRMETGEIIYKKYESPRPPPKISLRNDWMKELGSEVARQAESSQPTQPNTNPIYRTRRLVTTEPPSRSSAQEIDTRFSLDCENTNLFVERLEKDKDTDKDVDADRDRTERPVVDIDFRVSGLPHAVVKQAENSRVRELVKKIESPLRQDLQADLQQSNAYNPFSEKSKKMMQDMGKVELIELCETIPKVQCSECFLYWTQDIVCCTCGHLLRENQSSRRIIHRWQLDLLSIPNYVIKKGRLHGHRHGKTEAQRKHFIDHNLRKRCIKKNFEGIHDRFQKDFTFRDSQLRNDLAEEVRTRWTRMRRKISPIACRPTCTLDTKRIGGSLSTHLDAMNR